MHLKRLHVENFRSIERIDVELDSLVNVIIGPNAIGKTTILEAIRLAKAVLAPRTQSETTQALTSLGAMSPHMPQRIFPLAFTSNTTAPVKIDCLYTLTPAEIANIKSLQPQLAPRLAQQNAGLGFTVPNQVIAFLNSPQGIVALSAASKTIANELGRLDREKTIELNLEIDLASGRFNGKNQAQQTILSALEQSMPPSATFFSYFPADRALPIGEQPVQLGLADSSAQMESYNSQPQLKYNRLKSSIFNAIISGDEGRANTKRHFELIFDRILKGRKLGEIGVNNLGMLSIPIIDKESNATFEIDGLSSGEKGIILTFLLIAQSIERDGIVLLDEPELHLNPAVCRDLLQFFVDEYAEKKNIQAIVCSHSAEILAGTFERTACSLFHLRGPRSLTKVRHQDQGEIRDALKRLGSSESEALLYRGTVSVEGIHDVETLETGFDDLFRRYRLKERGGREEIEKDIKELQKAELRGEEIGYHFFIFDRDRKPTSLTNTNHVRLLQLERYCLENYLLDVEIMTDLSRDREFSDKPKNNLDETRAVMRELALAQLDENVSRSVFKELGLESICFDMRAVREPEAARVAQVLSQQIDVMKEKFGTLDQMNFVATFTRLFQQKKRQNQPAWEAGWQELCDGKRLFEDMRREGHIKGDLLKRKKTIIRQMRFKESDVYKLLAAQLRELTEIT